MFLPAYAPESVAGPMRRAEKPANGEPDGTIAGFRDRVVPGEVERLFPLLTERFKTEIRTRHYSMRTETAYAEWVRRFIAFHGYVDPCTLDAAVAAKEYLDYLAMEREVAANTQNQTLNALNRHMSIWIDEANKILFIPAPDVNFNACEPAVRQRAAGVSGRRLEVERLDVDAMRESPDRKRIYIR